MTVGRFLGLDLGGTNIKAVVLEQPDEASVPQVVRSTQHETRAGLGPDAVVRRLIEAGSSAVADQGPHARVGIGVPGLFEPDTGRIVLFPNLPGPWRGHSLRDPIGEALGVPATLINDARAFVVAEGTLGAGRGYPTLVGVTLGTGIGGGIMIDGRLHLGDFGIGGEVAHQVVVPDGPVCGCGNRGCVEALAKADTLAGMVGVDDVAEVYRRAGEGDQESLAAIETVAEYIGIGLANAVTLLGPSCIVIGGGIMSAGELALNPIRRAMEAHLSLVPDGAVAVVPASLGKWAGGIGAALAGRDHPEVRAR